MSMKIEGSELTSPIDLGETGKAEAAGKAAPTTEAAAVTIEATQDGEQSTAGPLGMDDLLAAPDLGARGRVLDALGASARGTEAAATTSTGETTATEGSTTSDASLTSKISTDTVDENASVAAMLVAGEAMIQAQQTSATASESERESSLSSYETEMDDEASHERTQASDQLSAGWWSGLGTGIGGVLGAVGSGVQGFGGTGKWATMLGGNMQNTGLLGNLGTISSGTGTVGQAYQNQAATEQQADQTTAQKFAEVYQTAESNAQSFRDTFLSTQSTVNQSLLQVVEEEGSGLESAAKQSA
jgi:hypothetical protein